VFRHATAWLRDRGRAPFFLFLHTYDVHDRCPFQEHTNVRAFVPWDDLDAAGTARLLSYYDDLIAETDTRIGTLLAEIDALGRREDTIIVITSDHGELFNEHGDRGHGCKPLYDPLVRVPLLIRYPAGFEPRAPGRSPVGIVDVAPTILKLLGLPQPATMTGAPLPGFGTEEQPRPVVVACNDYVAVRHGSLKLMATKDAPDQNKLFDLTHDPGETDNLFSGRRAETDPLLGLAQQHWAESLVAEPKSAPHELDAETKERLRALGYEP
jgi:arylsulfatase A-like enzyme